MIRLVHPGHLNVYLFCYRSFLFYRYRLLRQTEDYILWVDKNIEV